MVDKVFIPFCKQIHLFAGKADKVRLFVEMFPPHSPFFSLPHQTAKLSTRLYLPASANEKRKTGEGGGGGGVQFAAGAEK